MKKRNKVPDMLPRIPANEPLPGDIWFYDVESDRKHYLMLEVFEYRSIFDGKTSLHAAMLCLENGRQYPAYPWLFHPGWRKVA